MVRRKGIPKKYSPPVPPPDTQEQDTDQTSSTASRSTESETMLPPGMVRATPTKKEFSSTDSDGDRSGTQKHVRSACPKGEYISIWCSV